MALLFAPPFYRVTDNVNAPVPGGFIGFYATQTTTLQPVYADAGLTTALQNPVQADGNGDLPAIFLDDSLPPYKYILYMPDDQNPAIPGDVIRSGDPYNPTFNGTALTALLLPLIHPQSAAETSAGVTPTNFAFAPGDIRRYGTNTTPGTTDMSAAFQSAVSCNSLVILQAEIYLVVDVTLTGSVTFQGQGFTTVILGKTTTLAHGTYSQNIFTATAIIDAISFVNLTLDGGCAGPSNALDSSETPLVKITNTSKVTFDRVQLTRYCGAWSGVVKAISASFWEAIVIQNATKTIFRDCLFTNNHYEMVLIWNAPGSNNEVLIQGFSEINTGTPDAHSSFDINGGHVTVVDSFWSNTGTSSQLNVQVAQSVRVANCTFLGMQAGAAAQCNIGQDTFPYNSNVVIENNYFQNANSAAIAVGQGSSITIRGNVIDTPGNYGIKLTSGVTSFTTFVAEYPEWPAPSASGSNSILITDNTINAVNSGGTLACGIWLHTVNVNAGYWFQDVQIRGNTITAGSAPNNTPYGIRLGDCRDLIVRDNWLQYTINGLYLETLVQNVLFETNTFNGVAPSTNNDIIWVGAPTSSNVSIRRNRFNQWPVGVNGTINVFSGAVTGLEVIDNRNIHPSLPVQGPAITAFVAYQVNPNVRTTAAAPSTSGDFALNDVVKNVPTAAQPGEYLCTSPGSFGSIASCTATATTPNNFFTASAVAQLHVGMRFSIAGAGPAAANLTVVATYITGSTVYIDTVISTSVSGAALTVVNPTFVKSANYT